MRNDSNEHPDRLNRRPAHSSRLSLSPRGVTGRHRREAARAAHDDAVHRARDGMHRALVGLVAAADVIARATNFSYSANLGAPAMALPIWATSDLYLVALVERRSA